MVTQQQDVTGIPRWDLARDIVAQLREMPADSAEREAETRLHALLGQLFPNLRYPNIATGYESGNGPIDVYCRNVVFETKSQGKTRDARAKSDGSTETPQEQAVRYLDALTQHPRMFDDATIGWRACVTDGKEWNFYDYDREADQEAKLTSIKTLRLSAPDDDDGLLAFLHDFVDRTAKMTPPTGDAQWTESLVQPFLELAASYESTGEYEVKRDLWRGVLAGAFINPEGDAERDLFARHTMLVVIARAVAETLRPGAQQAQDTETLRDKLCEGFAAWLIDAAGADGTAALDDLTDEVNRYAWSVAERDTLKDLYHTVIDREIRHDFGEYYTPDWLARAVCEEVMDDEWRKETIAMAVANQLTGPAVLDPSCGSGTFLYHATQLLLEDARGHPELTNSPQAQVEVVDGLVAGMDLHPVAVELSKTTKMLAFAELASYASSANADLNIHLGDSLQWSARGKGSAIEFGEMVEIPTDEPGNPIRLPRTLLLSDDFAQKLSHVFEYANRPENTDTEDNLKVVLGLPTPADGEAMLAVYRRLREYIAAGKNNVWHWYIANLIQPLRLANMPATRLVGNPPWVVYNAMADDRQDAFRWQAQSRGIWSAGTGRAPQNDLAATFVATCVDFYLQSGGKFGFVLPYAALRARHWGPFRTGEWSLPPDAGRNRTPVDLSKDAWDLFAVSDPPFPQANSSVVFGSRPRVVRRNTRSKALSGVWAASNGEPVDTKMAWDEVKPRLQWNRRREWPTAPSDVYSSKVMNGTNLFPQSLVVFERPLSRARGIVYFNTNPAKGIWKGTDRGGNVEERFVRPALFSRLLLPFGTNGHSHMIAPFSEDGRTVLQELPQGEGVQRFNLYWASANADYVQTKKPKSPDTLAKMVDYISHLTTQLECENDYKVIYNSSGGSLYSAVVSTDNVCSHTLCWISPSSLEANHYLSAIFNARCLAEFFSVACRASDRDFIHLPVQNLPIPAYNRGNAHHRNLAAQSQLAHERVAVLVAERHHTTRNDVLRDAAMQPILASIDESVRAILPDYCS